MCKWLSGCKIGCMEGTAMRVELSRDGYKFEAVFTNGQVMLIKSASYFDARVYAKQWAEDHRTQLHDVMNVF